MKKLNRVGEKYITNEGYEAEIIEYINASDSTIKFKDGRILTNISYVNLKNGNIKNPYHSSVHEKGYIGVGRHSVSIGGKHTKKYITWNNMLERIFSKDYHRRFPTYSNCSISQAWLNFQTFGDWFEENYTEGYDLDKDILFKGNKVYSPETCCFVPIEINYLFTKCDKSRGDLPIGVTKNGNKFSARINKGGVRVYLGSFKTPEKAFQAYKKAKEKEIKDIAKLSRGLITEPCYQALISYEVSIND